MKYIELETAIEGMWARLYDGSITGPEATEKYLRSLPAADVAPVVHARWEPREDAPGFVRCSACRDCNVYDDWLDGKKWQYCPQCGAKMDLTE